VKDLDPSLPTLIYTELFMSIPVRILMASQIYFHETPD
jgi:hypothetical protein